MSISRKTPAGYEVEEAKAIEAETGPRAISDGPVSDVTRAYDLRSSTSDVAPVRRAAARATEPPTVVALGQEELLRLAATLPIEDGPEAVGRAIAEVVRDVIAPGAVGVVLRVDAEPRLMLALSPEARATEVHFARSEEGPPQRLFPALADEWIVPLPAPHEGSVHVADASGVIARDPQRSRSLAEIVERAALLVASGVHAARAVERSRVDGAQLRALQARIIQTEKLASVGQIAAKVVHELNNPLTAIVTYSGFLTKKLERAGHDPADVERLRRIGESADRILRFSRELTTYARPNEDAAGPVALHEVLERAVVFCEHVIVEHGIRVSTRFDPSLPPLLARRGQLIQVFVNLVTNACHAIHDAGRGEDGLIEITTDRTEDGKIRVSIGDNGNGISPEHVVRIFDPFFTTKPEGRGTGLGLSIVRSIVETHGGRVWVRTVQGVGSSFIVEFSPHTRPLTEPPGS